MKNKNKAWNFMNSIRLLVCLSMVLVIGPLVTRKVFSQEFKVGASEVDITPTEAVPMWGYGARHAALSEGTLDPLKASMVVVQAGRRKMAIVGLDLGRSPQEESLQKIRAQIKQQAGIDVSFISGSHTHHGPVLELFDAPGRGRGRFDAAIRYNQKLEESLVEGILQAHQRMVPAKLGQGSKELVGFNRNRHSKIQPAPVDTRLGVVRFDALDDGKNIATIVNFTGHPTNISSDIRKFSADYVGAMRATVGEQTGGIVVFMQGASGDISVDRTSHGDYLGYGKALGREVLKVFEGIEPKSVEAPSLKFKEDRFEFGSRTDFKNPLVQGVYSVAFFPELVENFVAEYQDGIRPRLTVAVLNKEIAFVGGSGEFFCQHAMRLRERARFDGLFFFGYCNGYHQYFPTIEGTAEGGYGADAQVAPAEIGAGEDLMNQALKWLYQIR
jgi:neutral ceramidase